MTKDNRPQWAIDAGISKEQLKNMASLDLPGIPDAGQSFNVVGKKQVYINSVDMNLVHALRKLPAHVRIAIVSLTVDEMTVYIKKERRKIREQLIGILRKQWYWRESGDVAEITQDCLPGTNLSQTDLLAAVSKRSKFNDAEMQAIIDWFLDGREVYLKEE